MIGIYTTVAYTQVCRNQVLFQVGEGLQIKRAKFSNFDSPNDFRIEVLQPPAQWGEPPGAGAACGVGGTPPSCWTGPFTFLLIIVSQNYRIATNPNCRGRLPLCDRRKSHGLLACTLIV